jgi:DNA invertase Pin-like site-specific DNA recombinase
MTTRPGPFVVSHPKTAVYAKDEKQLERMCGWCESVNYPVVFKGYDRQGNKELLYLLQGVEYRQFQLLLFNSVRDLSTSILQAARLLLFLDDRRIAFRSFTEKCFDSYSPYRENTLDVLSSIALIEQQKIETRLRRIRQGVDAAREAGKRPGRPSALSSAQVLQAASLRQEGATLKELSRRFHCHEDTIKSGLSRLSQQPSSIESPISE